MVLNDLEALGVKLALDDFGAALLQLVAEAGRLVHLSGARR
jgi:EAL domain-containing protein (putative c-di-GMP-specific phosphodiesterase class I)